MKVKKNKKVSIGENSKLDSRKGEFAILKIAFLLAALDGKIDETEREMYDRLAEQCKDVDVDLAQSVLKEVDAATQRLLNVKNELKSALPSVDAGLFMKGVFSNTGLLSENEVLLEKFMEEADAVCDWVYFVRDSSRVRRAFVMWTAMSIADGDFSKIERTAIECLREKVNSYKLIGEDFLKDAESKIKEIQKLSCMIGMATNMKKSSEFNDRREAVVSELDALIRN